MSAIIFIPLMIATLGLAYASFMAKRNNKLTWIIIAFIIWFTTFILTLYWNKIF